MKRSHVVFSKVCDTLYMSVAVEGLRLLHYAFIVADGTLWSQGLTESIRKFWKLELRFIAKLLF